MLSAVLAIGCWWLIFPPAWLLPPPVVIPPALPSVRNVATELVGQADAVVLHYRAQAGLPATLPPVESGSAPGQYLVTGPNSFEVRATVGDTTVVLPVSIPATGDPVYLLTTLIGGGR